MPNGTEYHFSQADIDAIGRMKQLQTLALVWQIDTTSGVLLNLTPIGELKKLERLLLSDRYRPLSLSCDHLKQLLPPQSRLKQLRLSFQQYIVDQDNFRPK